MKIDLNTVPKKYCDVWCPVEGQDGLIRIVDQHGHNLILNCTGSLIWQLIDGERNIGDIVNRLLKEQGGRKDLCPEAVQDETIEFLVMLSGREIVSLKPLSTWE